MCDQSTVDSFVGPFSAQRQGSDPVSVCADALQAVVGDMVFFSGVNCPFCPVSGECIPVPTNLSCGFIISGPFEVRPGLWQCRVTFEGTHNITCSGSCL
jgi:hypothetical protein